MEKFFEIHKALPREGPGDNTSTKKAYQTLKQLPSEPKILDIGCGPGMQTIQLGRLSKGHIVALDNHQPFLDQLNDKRQGIKLTGSIETMNGSMFNLEKYFDHRSFDLIWSEGAIFIIGFEKGLKTFGEFLRIDGYMAVTELSWLKQNPPKAIKAFWDEEYPQIKTIDENLEIIKKLDYQLIDYFVLPESSWWEHYYKPLKKRIKQLRLKYQGDAQWQTTLDNTQQEIDMYSKYSDYYGYVFYVVQKK